MKRLLLINILALTFFYANAQNGFSNNIKSWSEYAEQKQIASDIAAKSKAVPFAIPDYKSMVSVNESGDGIISLPLTTIKGRKLTLPVSITYVTNGIKVDQKSSEVGLGWSVNFGSIVRDYGAYEPDYTCLGKETEMLNSGGSPATNNIDFYAGSGNGSYQVFSTMSHNKLLEYSGVNSSRTPDLYHVNIPGSGSNSFWNTNNASSPTVPIFEFTQQEASKVDFTKQIFTLSQEISRINELRYECHVNNPHTFLLENSGYNFASAIGLYPYLYGKKVYSLGGVSTSIGVGANPLTLFQNGTNLPTPQAQLTYEDYSKFTITKPDGTIYIFGRALRGQKYFFEEEPFWSTRRNDLTPSSGSNDVYGEFWKTDYIAEWLLTEVRSADYVDINSNGIADDGDGGDWIRIDYTEKVQYESVLGIPVAIEVPKHREWINFTQTDKQSSLMRERAYVTKVTTPLEVIDFTNSERFDVDHDYFKEIFNRVRDHNIHSNVPEINNYVYITHPGMYTSLAATNDFNGNAIPMANRETQLKVNYPVETKKYDDISIKENISTTNQIIQQIKLKYAQKGSPDELAVSNYLILDNTKQSFVSYSPDQLGDELHQSRFYHANSGGSYNGRGKTTLKGIEFYGSNTTDKIAFSFNYNYNPSYNDIHIYQIQKKGALPILRESPSPGSTERWTSQTMVGNSTTTGVSPFAYSQLPIRTFTVDRNYNINIEDNFNNPIREDEFGNYYQANSQGQLGLNGRDAWSLTSIVLPYGGTINLEYERDECQITSDRNAWNLTGISDYATPPVANYNNIAHVRSEMQDYINYQSPNYSPSDPSVNKKTLYREFFFAMDKYSGGLRVKKIKFFDQYTNKWLTKTYNYGSGHYTAAPSEYWSKYFQAFGDFFRKERANHAYGQEYQGNISGVVPWQFDDFSYAMSRLMSNTRIDNSINLGKHYYEYVDEVNADNSKTRYFYGLLVPPSTSRLAYNPTLYGCIKGGEAGDRLTICDLLTHNTDHSLDIGNYKTVLYNNTGVIVEEKNTSYNYAEVKNNVVSLNNKTTVPFAFQSWYPQDFPRGNRPPCSGQIDGTSLFGAYDAFHSSACGTAYSVPPPVFFDAGLNRSELTSFGYDNNPSASFELSVTGQARMPYSIIGLSTGLLSPSQSPSWLTDLLTVNKPWSSSNSSVNVSLLSMYLSMRISAKNGMQNDRPYLINPLTYKSHQVYRMQTAQQSTKKYF